MLRTLLLALGTAALVWTGILPAQDGTRADRDSAVVSGTRIRLVAPPLRGWQVGTLDRLAPDSLFLRPCSRCASRAFRRDSITALAVSRGAPQRARNMLVGALVGAAVGTAVVVGSVHGCHDGGEGPPCALGYTAVPLVAVGGAILGGGVGRLLSPERWEPVRGVRGSNRADTPRDGSR
jgi:hypothetical protein